MSTSCNVTIHRCIVFIGCGMYRFVSFWAAIYDTRYTIGLHSEEYRCIITISALHNFGMHRFMYGKMFSNVFFLEFYNSTEDCIYLYINLPDLWKILTQLVFLLHQRQ